MSFILTPENGEDVVINAWNWRPTLELLLNAKLIDKDLYDRMGTHGREASVDADTARNIADFLDGRVFEIRSGDRIRSDLSTTAEPRRKVTIVPGTRVEDIDAVDLYSASFEWLLQFRDFSRASGGFKVS
jgi:hypothetical protein